MTRLIEQRDLRAAEGWSLVLEYEDHETGSRADRPRFQQNAERCVGPKVANHVEGRYCTELLDQ
jgi:hypothetical protein